MASRLKSFIASLQSKLGERKKKWDLYIISLYILGFEIGENQYNFILVLGYNFSNIKVFKFHYC